MSVLRSALVIPLVVVAVLGITLGFIVARELAPITGEPARLSVIALPPTSTPKPSPTPEATPPETTQAPPRSDGRGGGSDGGGSGSCPAGCTCESRPPGGIVIVCR